MARKRNIRGERDARRCLAAMKASGQTQREWACQHQIDGRSLYAWAKKLAPDEKANKSRARNGMVELIPDSRLAASRYVVRCGQLAVEVDERFDEATLRRLLKVVAAC